MSYLALLDSTLAAGASLLGEAFCRRQAAAVWALRRSDGTFPDRRGGADLYYTRFALETLTVLGLAKDEGASLASTGEYVAQASTSLASMTDWLSFLHAARLLEGAGLTMFCCTEMRAAAMDRAAAFVASCRGTDGTYAVAPGSPSGPYHTFLAALVHELAGRELPEPATAGDAMRAWLAADGGFAESPGRERGQTNPTAAAVAVMTMTGRLDERTTRGAAAFLASMQTAEGGMKAHAALGRADLLSTFTALTTLVSLDEIRRVRLGHVGRFVRSLAKPEGGFVATAGDEQVDAEYTFYGVATLALLAQAASA
jgi:geranylgeranyl transferase type-2 subunit beta